MKSRVDFKINLEQSSNFNRILKEETIRNSELRKEFDSLTRLQKAQNIYIKNYDKDYQVSSKLNLLQKEIKTTKNAIKDFQIKYTKLDKFIKLIHEKIIGIEMIIKKGNLNKEEPKKKSFTREELKEALETMNNIKNQITEKRNQLNILTKQNDIKISKMLEQNKQIETEYKENEKTNKMLIFKRNELQRNIKNLSVNGVNKNKNNIVKNKPKINKNIARHNNININNNDINENNMENELENEAEFHECENNDEQNKLFGKNPNKRMENNNEGDENIDNGGGIGEENMEQDYDEIENNNVNDINPNVEENNINNNGEENEEF